MLAEVKRCAERHDVTGLRYIFVDSLDVDPTFEKYKEEYEFCKGIEGFFEPHKELTALVLEKSGWNMGYWERLKLDLIKNFSSRRFEHMIQVAKVVYADKIARLLEERKARQQGMDGNGRKQAFVNTGKEPGLPGSGSNKAKGGMGSEVRGFPDNGDTEGLTPAQMQEKLLEEKKRELELENRRTEEERRRKEEQRQKRAQAEAAQRNMGAGNGHAAGRNDSKKHMGIVLAVIAVAAIVLIFIILKVL